MTDKELRDLAEKLKKIADGHEMPGWFTIHEQRLARNMAVIIESVLHFPLPVEEEKS